MIRLLAILTVTLLLLGNCNKGGPYLQSAHFYTPGPGPNEVTLFVHAASPAIEPEATVVSQDRASIRVRVQLPEADARREPQIGPAYEVSVVVRLKAPLDDRSVLNEDGTTVVPSPAFSQ